MFAGAIEACGYEGQKLDSAISQAFRNGYEEFQTDHFRQVWLSMLGAQVALFACSVRAGELNSGKRHQAGLETSNLLHWALGATSLVVAAAGLWVNYLAVSTDVAIEITRVSAYGPGGNLHPDRQGEILEMGIEVAAVNRGRQPLTLSRMSVEGFSHGGQVKCSNYALTDMSSDTLLPSESVRLEANGISTFHVTCDMGSPVPGDDIADLYRNIKRLQNWLAISKDASPPRAPFPILVLTVEAHDVFGRRYRDSAMLGEHPMVPHMLEHVVSAVWEPVVLLIKNGGKPSAAMNRRDFVRPRNPSTNSPAGQSR
jgi:hypothetical protein